MKKSLILGVALFAALASVRADTSYLLIQGPFGPGNTVETFQWAFNYATGEVVTGQDMLDEVFGTPVQQAAGYTDAYSATYPYYVATNGAASAGYITSIYTPGFLAISYTLDGTTVTQDPTYDPGWDYYVEGGTGDDALGYDEPGAYPDNGIWNASNDGPGSRQVADGSYDAWVFGASGSNDEPLATVSGTNYAPTTADFASVPVTDVPEPGCIALLSLGLLGIWRTARSRG